MTIDRLRAFLEDVIDEDKKLSRTEYYSGRIAGLQLVLDLITERPCVFCGVNPQVADACGLCADCNPKGHAAKPVS